MFVLIPFGLTDVLLRISTCGIAKFVQAVTSEIPHKLLSFCSIFRAKIRLLKNHENVVGAVATGAAECKRCSTGTCWHLGTQRSLSVFMVKTCRLLEVVQAYLEYIGTRGIGSKEIRL